MGWSYVRATYGREYINSVEGKRGVKIYLVKSDTAITDISDVQAADDGVTAIPSLGDSWSGGTGTTGLKVFSIEPEEIEKEQALYQVRVEYATEDDNDEFVTDPTDREWIVGWDTEYVEEVPTHTVADASGVSFGSFSGLTIEGVGDEQPVENTILEPFEPPHVDRRALSVCTLENNYTSAEFAALGGVSGLNAYRDTTNDASLTIAGQAGDAFTFLMDTIYMQNRSENGVDYIYVRYRVIYDPQFHIAKVLNASMNYLTTGNALTTVVPNMKGGSKVARPKPIQKDGTLVGSGDKRYYRGFALKELTTWSSLSLPTALPT